MSYEMDFDDVLEFGTALKKINKNMESERTKRKTIEIMQEREGKNRTAG